MAAKLLIVLAACCLGAIAEKVRPCEPVTNECLGRYFEAHANCYADLAHAVDLSHIVVPHIYFNAPFFNVTVDRTDIHITNLHTTITQDFFVNPTTGRAVLTTFYPYFEEEGIAAMHIQIPGDEPFSFSAPFELTFVNLTVTTLFFDHQNLDFANSFSSAYVPVPSDSNLDDQTENLRILNNLRSSALRNAALRDNALRNEHLIDELFDSLAEYPLASTMELMAYRAPVLAQLITNNRICDYSIWRSGK